MTVGRGQIAAVTTPSGRTAAVVETDGKLSFILSEVELPVFEESGRADAIVTPSARLAVTDHSGRVAVTDSPGRVAVTDVNPRYEAREL